MSEHRLPEDCFLGYYLPSEAWYASATAREKPSIMVGAPSTGGGTAWEFSITEHQLGGPTVQIGMFGDAFDALEQIPAFFSALVEQRPSTLDQVRTLLDLLGAQDTTERRAPSMNGREIMLRQDLERAALDAYSVVFEPSCKLTRDHQRAMKAAIADAVRVLADEHQRLTDGERCCGPSPDPQCLRCGAGDETATWLRMQAERLSPTPVVDSEPPQKLAVSEATLAEIARPAPATSRPCEYTHSHTRHFCGRASCRECFCGAETCRDN